MFQFYNNYYFQNENNNLTITCSTKTITNTKRNDDGDTTLGNCDIINVTSPIQKLAGNCVLYKVLLLTVPKTRTKQTAQKHAHTGTPITRFKKNTFYRDP